jgi:hypothetical protein
VSGIGQSIPRARCSGSSYLGINCRSIFPVPGGPLALGVEDRSAGFALVSVYDGGVALLGSATTLGPTEVDNLRTFAGGGSCGN